MIELIADIGVTAVDLFIDLWINKVVTRLKKK